MNAGQNAKIEGRYEFSKPHSSHRSRLRRLKQIVKMQLPADQVDMTPPPPVPDTFKPAFSRDDFEMRYVDDEDTHGPTSDDHTDDRSELEPRPADQTVEALEGVSREQAAD